MKVLRSFLTGKIYQINVGTKFINWRTQRRPLNVYFLVKNSGKPAAVPFFLLKENKKNYGKYV